jgi:hypothetical protein
MDLVFCQIRIFYNHIGWGTKAEIANNRQRPAGHYERLQRRPRAPDLPVDIPGGTGWPTSRHGTRLGHQGGCPAVEAAARFALAWAGMMTALASGAFLGLSCGLAPGPLLALLLA